MGFLVLVISGISHYLLTKKIEYWMTISALGFKTQTPLGYLQSPGTFHLVNRVLGVAVLVSTLLEEDYFYIGIIVWILIQLSTAKTSRKLAYDKYREIVNELIINADEGEDTSDYEEYRAKTDEELAEMVDRAMKSGA